MKKAILAFAVVLAGMGSTAFAHGDTGAHLRFGFDRGHQSRSNESCGRSRWNSGYNSDYGRSDNGYRDDYGRYYSK